MKLNHYLIKIKGLNIDSALIKIYNNKIQLKNLKRTTHEEAEFVVSKNDYKKIEKILSNFECTKKELGLNKFKRYVLAHVSVILAIPIIAYFCYLASLFVWDIHISGLQEIQSKEVISLLSENGIKRGELKDFTEVEIEKLLLDSGMFAQVSCYFRGTSLMINVSEKLVYEVVEFQPIKAKYGGIITDYTLYQGTINFVLGEYVNAGDILVYPYIIDKDNNKVLVEPKAHINAKIYLSATVTKHKNETILVQSGKTATRYIIAYKTPKKSFLNCSNPFVFFEVKVYNKYVSKVLPFIRQKVVFTELVEQVKVNDLNALKDEIEMASKNLAESLVETEEFLDEITSSVIVDDILYATTTLTFIGSII